MINQEVTFAAQVANDQKVIFDLPADLVLDGAEMLATVYWTA